MGHRRVRFAIIGAGNFGPVMTTIINEVADIVAVCDPSPQARTRFSQSTGLRLPEFDDHERLLTQARCGRFDGAQFYAQADRACGGSGRQTCFL